MVVDADGARLALLIAYYEATKEFTDQGAVALLRWYEAFCISQGNNTTEPLELSGKGIRKLSELIAIPLSFGVPYIKLANNPDLTDITALQEMPILAKLGTIEHAIEVEQSPHLVRAMRDIRTALLESTTKVKLSLEGLDNIPIYLQLLSNVEDLALCRADEVTSLTSASSLKKLNRLDLDAFCSLLNLKSLTDLSSLKILKICHMGCCNFLEGIENFPSLEVIDISCTNIGNALPLEKLPNLAKLVLQGVARIVNQILRSNFPALRELSIADIHGLRVISIGQSLPSLRSISITGAYDLLSITGLNYLSNLEKLSILHTKKLCELGGIGEAETLQDITLGRYNIDFLRQILQTQLASGRYQALQPIVTPKYIEILQVDLLKDKFNQEIPMEVRLLEHQSAALTQLLVHTAVVHGPFETAPNSPLPPERESFIACIPRGYPTII